MLYNANQDATCKLKLILYKEYNIFNTVNEYIDQNKLLKCWKAKKKHFHTFIMYDGLDNFY